MAILLRLNNIANHSPIFIFFNLSLSLALSSNVDLYVVSRVCECVCFYKYINMLLLYIYVGNPQVICIKPSLSLNLWDGVVCVPTRTLDQTNMLPFG